MAATLAQRALTTQSYGTEAGAVGSFLRRPYGPKLAGWTDKGWSASNANAQNNMILTLTGASQTKGLAGAWYNFGIGSLNGGNGILEPLRLIGVGGVEKEVFLLDITTMQIQFASYNGWFANPGVLKTIPLHTEVFLFVSWDTATGTVRVMYREAGGIDQLLATVTIPNMIGQSYNEVHFGTLAQVVSLIPARIGLPSVYSITSIANDSVYPADIIEPSTVKPEWWISSAAVGGGDGTSLATAWTAAEGIAEVGPNNYTVTGGNIIDSVGVPWDLTLNADALAAAYKYGILFFNGNIIYFDDSAGPVRLTSQFAPTQATAVRLLPNPALGRRVEIRGTVRLTGAWTQISGANYKKAVACKYPVVFEFPSLAAADSPTGKARWLAHPAGITTPAGFAAASTDGSFGTDGGGGSGTEVYLRATGGGDPAGNGNVYEVTTGGDGDLILMAGTHGQIKDLILRYCAAVDTNNTPAPLGRCPSLAGNGLFMVDNCDIHGAGRHAITVFELGHALKQRMVVLRNTVNDCRPAAYGDQTIIVNDGTTDGRDNQLYYESNICTTNSGVVGSTAGTVDTTVYTTLEHGNVAATHVYSKSWFINNTLLGAASMGAFTSNVVLRGNRIGFVGNAASQFGGTTLTMTQNRITGAGLPQIGEAGGTATIRSNVLISTGFITVTPTWVGTVACLGNTIDARTTTGGVGSALVTRGGVLNVTFGLNIVRLNNSDAHRVFGTITPASGDTFGMGQCLFEGTDSNRILVNNYAGGTLTLAQLQAHAPVLDFSSGFAPTIGLDPIFLELTRDSQARNYGNTSLFPAIAGTPDFFGRLRPASGSIDIGAIIYHDRHREMYFEPAEAC